MRARTLLLVALAFGTAVSGTPAAFGAAAEEAAVPVVEPAVTEQVSDGGTTTFWVSLDTQADLAVIQPGDAAEVYAAKTDHAERTQAGLRELLTERGASFTPYWMVNQIEVTGDAALVAEVADRPEVARIEAADPIEVPALRPEAAQAAVNAVEWNIDRINAPRVWNELGVRGEGIVVASIDTGVQHNHPALVASYRGTRPDGTFDHDYNWFDATGECFRGTPCDPVGHGTHTMGTMVGADGQNQIGAAPGARWISARACGSACELRHLLAAGQWIVAPTDADGANPRPDLAPHVVNNSWGADMNEDPWYAEMVRTWIAAGIFPAFSNGNSGDFCVTSGAPGVYPESYSTGAFDSANVVAAFSSRGPGLDGHLKPNITAPGVAVRSSIPGGYFVSSGTSMASPHTAATVALMWSRAPTLVGNIEATRSALDGSAVDTDDTSCGGTPERNNVYGEGRLDAYAAVTATPRDPVGDLSGLVSAGDTAVADAAVELVGPVTRQTRTGTDGRYRLTRLPAGEYTVEITEFHHEDASTTVTVTDGGNATIEHTMVRLPHGIVSGTIAGDAGPALEATVSAVGTPASTTLDENGNYALELPHGEYRLAVDTINECVEPAQRAVTVSGDLRLDVTLSGRTDGYGYRCRVTAGADWVEGTESLGIFGSSGGVVELPFPFPIYGQTHREVWVDGTGYISFGTEDPETGNNDALPTGQMSATSLFPNWNIWYSGTLRATTLGTAPNRTYVIEWPQAQDRDVSPYARISFAVHLREDGSFGYRYRDLFGGLEATGGVSTIGLQDADHSAAFQYSLNQSVIREGLGIDFTPGGHGVVRGAITDGNDGGPVAGATVTLRSGGEPVGGDVTGADGAFVAQVPPGSYEVAVEAGHYRTVTGQATVTDGGAATFDSTLPTALVSGPPAEPRFVVPAGESRHRSFVITNGGAAATGFAVTEAVDVPWLSVSTPSGSLEPGAQGTVSLALDTEGLAPGTVHRAEVVVASDSGRGPLITVPVALVVPGYVVAVDAGSPDDVVDSLGDRWLPDRSHTSGSYGHVGRSRDERTNRDIAGTTDDERFRTTRSGLDKYQFDGLAPGTYTVELDFAELRSLSPGKRIFDVVIESNKVLPALDVADAAGVRTALRHTFAVQVTDGTLDVQFVEVRGYGDPMVNAIRVTQRPDLDGHPFAGPPGR